MKEKQGTTGGAGVGENITAENAAWSFKGNVAQSFTSHVRRSVPFYDEGHDLICGISDFFVRDGSVCYDLGTSTAALLKNLAARHETKGAKFVGIDSEEDMVKQAAFELGSMKNVTLLVDDICAFDYEPADLIVAYYTFQFIPPKLRQDLMDRIFRALNWGGGFLMFEKVRGPDARFQDMMTALYTDYKLEQGYSGNEIVAKSRSLKNVLEPFSTQGNVDLLKRAGFVDVMSVMKYVCFEGFLAIK